MADALPNIDNEERGEKNINMDNVNIDDYYIDYTDFGAVNIRRFNNKVVGNILIQINQYDNHVKNEYYTPLLNHILELERRVAYLEKALMEKNGE